MRTYQGDLVFLPNVIGTMIDFMVSSKRITDFMLIDKMKTLRCKENQSESFDLIIENIGFSHPKEKKIEKRTVNKPIEPQPTKYSKYNSLEKSLGRQIGAFCCLRVRHFKAEFHA